MYLTKGSLEPLKPVCTQNFQSLPIMTKLRIGTGDISENEDDVIETKKQRSDGKDKTPRGRKPKRDVKRPSKASSSVLPDNDDNDQEEEVVKIPSRGKRPARMVVDDSDEEDPQPVKIPKRSKTSARSSVVDDEVNDTSSSEMDGVAVDANAANLRRASAILKRDSDFVNIPPKHLWLKFGNEKVALRCLDTTLYFDMKEFLENPEKNITDVYDEEDADASFSFTSALTNVAHACNSELRAILSGIVAARRHIKNLFFMYNSVTMEWVSFGSIMGRLKTELVRGRDARTAFDTVLPSTRTQGMKNIGNGPSSSAPARKVAPTATTKTRRTTDSPKEDTVQMASGDGNLRDTYKCHAKCLHVFCRHVVRLPK